MTDNELAARALYETEGAEWLMEKASPAYTEALLTLLSEYVRLGDKVLDVCCGYGRLTLPLLRRQVEVTGVDVSETLLRTGVALFRRSDLGARPFVGGSLTRLPFAGGSFDFAFCVWASFHFLVTQADQQQALSEMHRVLRPGGRILIEGPLHEDTGPTKVVPFSRGSYHYRPVTVDEMRALAAQSLFTTFKVEPQMLAGSIRMLAVLSKAS